MRDKSYTVTINKWLDHNPKHKKGMRHFKFYNAFFNDPKIAELTQTEALLFINLLCISSEASSKSCLITTKVMPKQYQIGTKVLEKSLDRLEQLQLVTVEKISLIKEIKEIKDNKHGAGETENPKSSEPAKKRPAETASPKTSQLTFQVETVEQLEGLISEKVWTQWSHNFEASFIDREIQKAVMWSLNNPKKGRKTAIGWSRTMTAWLVKAWDEYSKRMPPAQKAFNNQDFRP